PSARAALPRSGSPAGRLRSGSGGGLRPWLRDGSRRCFTMYSAGARGDAPEPAFYPELPPFDQPISDTGFGREQIGASVLNLSTQVHHVHAEVRGLAGAAR